jgi:hypothetical protein
MTTRSTFNICTKKTNIRITELVSDCDIIAAKSFLGIRSVFLIWMLQNIYNR